MENKTQTSNKRQSKSSLDQGKKRISSPNQHHKRRTHALRTNKISLSDKRIALTNAQETDLKEVEDKSIKKILSSDIKIEQGKNIIYFAGTHPGTDESGTIKENQDSFSFIENVFGLDNCNIYSVMDGHGTNGHFVSQFCGEALKKFFSDENNIITKKEKGKLTKDLLYQKLTSNNYSLLKKFFNKLQEDLINASFDTHFSGTTMVVIYQIDNKIICSNIGDSRAILVSNIGNEDFQAIKLSNDQKPTNPEEQKRIEESGGEIATCDDEKENEGIKRVWVKGEKFPGIAISRTLGDEVAKSVGVICTPEFIEKNYNSESYIIVASDGLWEFYSDEQVKDLSYKQFLSGDYIGLVKTLMIEVSGEWGAEGPVRDDITVICHVLNKK
jgi:serine/threonine protein phosphatase PrpC